MDVFGVLIEKFEVTGFAPLAPLQKSKSTFTLFNAVRDLCGMTERIEVTIPDKRSATKDVSTTKETHVVSDEADVSFWNYKELRAYLDLIFDLINEGVSNEVGSKTDAVAWSHDPSRTKSEVIEVMRELQKIHPNLDPPPHAIRRPKAKQMVQIGKVEAAIGNTCAVLNAGGSNYGDLFETMSHCNLTDESLLDFLDDLVYQQGLDTMVTDKTSLVPKSLVKTYVSYRARTRNQKQKSCTMADFLGLLSEADNLSGNSDETIIHRLESLNFAVTD